MSPDLHSIVMNLVGSMQVKKFGKSRVNQIILQIFRVTNKSCAIISYKLESLILYTIANNKLNTPADKAVNTNKRWDIAANIKLNTVAYKVVNASKKKTMQLKNY